MKALRIFFIVLFLLILVIPGFVLLTGWKDKTASFENKAETPMPVFKLSNLDPFPAKYEDYYNTHFPARNSLLFLYNYFQARYLLKSPKPSEVTIGSNGWLYLANYEQQVYTGELRFSKADLQQTVDELNYRKQVCDSLGAEYRVVIVPSKFSIYPEFLPPSLTKYEGDNATDQFVKAMRSQSSVPVLDLRPVLQNFKKEGLLFMKGDNHWNSLGAYCGYKSIIDWLRTTYRIPPPLPQSELRFYDTLVIGNIIGMLGMDKYWHNTFLKAAPLHPLPEERIAAPDYPCPPKFGYPDQWIDQHRMADTSLPSILVIRESFATVFFRDLFSCHFKSSLYIWDNWEHRLNRNIIQGQKPKIVLCIVIESMIDCFKNYPDKPVLQKPASGS
ncbi:MAG TPA: hypothetical protein VNZ86_00685 [Bacteroidia bacterium]|jgi:hypothetical protein|nr:hypothetical protein [Bacteroidia bacterium]